MGTELLHSALPSKCNTQQIGGLRATIKATTAQQPTLKALSGAVLGRNSPSNSSTTDPKKVCNNTGSELRSFVASRAVLPSPVNEKLGSPRVELLGLIRTVGMLYGFTPEETAEANQIAFADPKSALASYRDVAKRYDLNVQTDDRVTCGECSRLVRGRCQAAKLGLIADTSPDYSPVADIPRRCEFFKGK